MKKVCTNNTVADALCHMVEPTHGRTTRGVGYWATAIGQSQSSLYMKCQGERPLTVKELIDITNATGDPLALEAVTAACGCVAFKVAQQELPVSIPLVEQINDTVQQQAEAIRCVCEAVKDGVTDDEERANIDREILEMMASMSRLREMVHQLPKKASNVKQFKASM